MLNNTQIAELATALDEHSGHGPLELIARDLGVTWANLIVGVSFRRHAEVFIRYLIEQNPPRDGELLEVLRTGKNAELQAVADRLIKPTYYSPTGDAHDAIILGQMAFIARPDLRSRIRGFTSGVNMFTTRMLVVRGVTPGGKSYTWSYLRHLAFSTVGAYPFRLRLKGKGEAYTPRHLFEDVFSLLDMNVSLPPLTDDPQLARLDALLSKFKGKIVGLERRCWLVIDDLNDPVVTPSVREAAFSIAHAAEELKPERLWVALLGYNEPIVDPELRSIAQDDAEYPSQSEVARYLQQLSNLGPRPLEPKRALEIANLLFQKYTHSDEHLGQDRDGATTLKLTRVAMFDLTDDIQKMGEMLRQGAQP